MNNDFLPFRVIDSVDKGFDPKKCYPGMIVDATRVRIANEDGRMFLMNIDQARIDVPSWRQTTRYASIERSTEELRAVMGSEIRWLINAVKGMKYIKSKAKLEQTQAELMNPVRTVAELIGDHDAVDLAYTDVDLDEVGEEIPS